MKNRKIFIIVFMIIGVMTGCSNSSSPDDMYNFKDKIEFYYFRCLDDSCKITEMVVSDTIFLGFTPGINVTIENYLYKNDIIMVFLVDSDKDTIYRANVNILDNDTRHIYFMSYFRPMGVATYQAYGYYTIKNIRYELPPRTLVIKLKE